MAFTTGTATDWIDLANKLRLWLTGTAGWTQLAWTPGDVNLGGMSLYLRGPGAAADKQVFINIQSVQDDTVPAYAWDVRGAVAYNAALPFINQVGVSTQTLFALWKSTITYWFYANDRRFIIAAKANTVYLSLYAGFGLPWATPAEYPFPLYIGGSDGILRQYNATDSAHGGLFRPGAPLSGAGTDVCGGKVRKQDGTWTRVLNQIAGGPNDSPIGMQSSAPYVFPFNLPGAVSNQGTREWTNFLATAGGTSDLGTVDNLVATQQGERLLMPVSIMNVQEPAGVMALDGVYFPMGQGLTPEQTATLGARNFRVFCNVHRTSCNDFIAIEEI